MKASSLFAVTIAALLGLGAVAGAKYAGLFDRPEPKPEPKAPPVKVLVSSMALFEGITVTQAMVRLRDLYPEEQAHYQKNKSSYMPALLAAAHMRIASRNIEADTPLLKEHFEDTAMPSGFTERVPPYYRTTNVSIPKERCGGGLLRVGEYVDVYLTSQITAGREGEPFNQTACLARGAKIVVKRNTLWPVLQSNSGDQPISFTLMLNPYRTALVEFAKTGGNLTLMPAPIPPEEMVKRETKARPVWSDPNSGEYRAEDERVDRVVRGELVVGARDLERIFQLPYITPAPPATPLNDTVVHINGLRTTGVTLLPQKPVDPKVFAAAMASLGTPTYDKALGYRFHSPDALLTASSKKAPMAGDCPECEAKAAEVARKARGF